MFVVFSIYQEVMISSYSQIRYYLYEKFVENPRCFFIITYNFTIFLYINAFWWIYLVKKWIYSSPEFFIINNIFEIQIFIITSFRFFIYIYIYIFLYLLYFILDSWVLAFRNGFLNLVVSIIALLSSLLTNFDGFALRCFFLKGESLSNISINIFLTA